MADIMDIVNTPDGKSLDLAEVLAWCRKLTVDGGDQVTPARLQRRYSIGWNAACSALEALERDGDLERLPGPTIAYRPTSGPGRPGKGYALPLSAKEHGALLRGLDKMLAPLEGYPLPQLQDDMKYLRQIRARLKRPHDTIRAKEDAHANDSTAQRRR